MCIRPCFVGNTCTGLESRFKPRRGCTLIIMHCSRVVRPASGFVLGGGCRSVPTLSTMLCPSACGPQCVVFVYRSAYMFIFIIIASILFRTRDLIIRERIPMGRYRLTQIYHLPSDRQ